MSNGTVFGGLVATMDVEDYSGAFTISVEYVAPFSLPETGGVGTFGYRCSGALVVMLAVLLVWKKKNSKV